MIMVAVFCIFYQDYGNKRSFIGEHKSANLEWLRYRPLRRRNCTRFADKLYDFCRLGHHAGSTFNGTDRNGRP